MLQTGKRMWAAMLPWLWLHGQTSVPTFEVASIKPDTSADMHMMINADPGAGFRASGVPLKLILEQAYGLKDAQIVGAPGWLGSDRFVIDAKPDEATVEEMRKLTPDERNKRLMLMLQSLLVERCKLSVRKETRDLPVYSLVVAKNGPKFHEAAADAPGRNSIRMRRGQIEASDVALDIFVDTLSRQLGKPVVDHTGLKGKYDFALTWTPDEHDGQMAQGPPSEETGPSLFTAVQEQLGLKLEPAKSPMAVLVIDHIEKPSAN